MRHGLIGLFCCALMTLATAASHAQHNTNGSEHALLLGVLPSQSPVTQFKQLAPLRDYLAQQLKMPVEIKTAKNYAQHLSDIKERQYDILMTAPHMALLASDQGRYVPIATFTQSLAAVVVVREDSPIQALEALAGAGIATPSEKAIVTMVGKNYLEEHIKDQEPPRYTAFLTHNAAYKAVMAQQASAAIIANFIYRKAKSEGAKLRIVGESPHFPGIGLLVAKNLSPDLQDSIRNTFLDMEKSEQGRQVIQHMTYPPYTSATKEQFESLRPYLNALSTAR